MTGIFPTAGVPAGQTQGGMSPEVEDGCDPLFYAPRCNPRMDPFAQNNLISELLTLINGAGIEYDCTRQDNLLRAIQEAARMHVISVNRRFIANAPLILPTGSVEAILENSTINIPNTSGENIRVNIALSMHVNVSAPEGVGSTCGAALYTDSARTQQLMLVHGIFEMGRPTTVWDVNSVALAQLVVPPGGMTLYTSWLGVATGADANMRTGIATVTAYGIAGTFTTTTDV